MDKVLFSRNSDDWTTPPQLYDLFVKKMGCFDPCPLGMPFDGLLIEWSRSRVFINPPYSNIKGFVDKAIVALSDYASGVNDVFFLVPSRTDTKWFFDLFRSPFETEFYFINGRLKFGGSVNCAPFPSVVIHISRDAASYYGCWMVVLSVDELIKRFSVRFVKK